MGQQTIYVEGLGFIPVAAGQTPQQAIAAAQSKRPGDAAKPARSAQQPSALESIADTGEGMARGALKGAGETAFHLGDIMRHVPTDAIIPGISALTGMKNIGDIGAKIGGMDSDRAFAQVPEDLQPSNGAETAGKTLEQIAEFFIPAGKVGMAQRGAAELVGNMPKAAGTVRKLATDAAWKAAPVLDDAVAAGGTALAHGDNWEGAGATSAASAVLQSLGIGAGQAARLLQNDTVRKLMSILAGGIAGKAAGGVTGDLVNAGGAGLGTYAMARSLFNKAAQNPSRLMWQAESAGRSMAPVVAGAVDRNQSETRRRRP